MKELIPTSVTPPNGYSYTQEETGHTMTADSFHQLMSKVVAHRYANNLPVPFNIDSLIEQQICDTRPELCREPKPKSASSFAHLTLELAVRFTKTLYQAGAERVDQSTADSRAAICVDCEDNVEPEGCNGCRRGWIKKAIEFIAGTGKTSYDDRLKACKHCLCFNSAQIWMPLDALQKQISETENAGLPDHCWKKRNEQQQHITTE